MVDRGSFAANVKAFAEVTNQRIDVATRQTMAFLISAIDEGSPVGNPELWVYNRAGKDEPPDYVHYLAYNDWPEGYVGGRFRANNQLGVDERPTKELDAVDKTGQRTVKVNIGKVPKEAAGHVYWLVNNLPYAARLEFDHWSTQAPDGIYGKVALDFNSNVAKAVRLAKEQVK